MRKIVTIGLVIMMLFVAVTPSFAAELREVRDDIIGTVTITNGDSVRVRASSNAESEQIGLVNPGEQYECVGVAANGWYEIVYPTGQTGFISNNLSVLQRDVYSGTVFSYPIGTVTVTYGGDVRTRNGGSTDYTFMGSIHSGDTFACVGLADSGWPAILLENGWIVYVSSDLVSLEVEQEIEEPVAVNPIPQSAILVNAEILGIVTVTSDRPVNVREGGGTDYETITQVQPGDVFSYIGDFEGGSWRGIVLSDGSVGYVAPGMVELTLK